MGKDTFLEHFQRNLAEAIADLLINQWKRDEFEVYTEYRDVVGKFAGIIDIAIRHKEMDNTVVAIEIEHKSSYDQAKRNIEKMKTWSHNSSFRSCSFLHIFNEGCYFSEDAISALVSYAKQVEGKGLGFHYDFIFYKVDDRRLTRGIATDLVGSMDFRIRLWMILELAGMI